MRRCHPPAAPGGRGMLRPSPLRRSLVVTSLLLAVACGPGEGSVFGLSEGACFDDPEATEDIREVPVVPCDEPHDNEVFATLDLDDGEFPGGEVVEEQALDGCTEAFPEVVAERYGDTELVIGVLTPSPDSWEGGDREVVCFLSSPDGMLTGSLLEDRG